MKRPEDMIAQKKPLAEASSRAKKKRKANTNVKNEKSEEKDSDRPKRPVSPFFIFMEQFSNFPKEMFPENAVRKAGTEKWNSMSDTEKLTYDVEFHKRMDDYNKAMKSYRRKANDAKDEAKDEDSGKSTSEVQIHDQ
ncbi:hypothetical protein NE237_032795 [Protea cynaroides]|uniref:HMG box domain-containing protein n=1 Tax=Protea cynaroides TaxID=273540 RepID=A0A9Q0R3E9_9MAGN|nr:hypothetical protein NE237_032795 [Protea cynaroides]